MSFDAAETGILTRFNTRWANRCPLVFENVEWPDPASSSSFVTLTVVEATGSKIELRETGLVRYFGTIILQVFVEKGKGTGITSAHADAFGDIFRLAEFSTGAGGLVRCRVPDKVPIGATNGWYQTNVRCSYIRDVYQSRAA